MEESANSQLHVIASHIFIFSLRALRSDLQLLFRV